MKKILVALIAIMCVCDGAHAQWRKGDGCFLDDNPGKWWGLNDDVYYFCGIQRKCDGRVPKSNGHAQKNVNVYDNLKGFEHNGVNYVCCLKPGESIGHFVTTNKDMNRLWEDNPKEEKIHPFSGGRHCMDKVYEDVCGGDHIEYCNENDALCEDGQFYRNNECVARCEVGAAFESATSNRCVSCPENEFTKVIDYIAGGRVRPKDDFTSTSTGLVCLKCNPDTQVLDKDNNKCVPRKEMIQYTRAMMKQCYACEGRDLFKKCVDMFSRPASERSGVADYADIKKYCYLGEAEVQNVANE